MARGERKSEVERREDKVLKRMLETPPRPHEADKKGENSKKGGARKPSRAPHTS